MIQLNSHYYNWPNETLDWLTRDFHSVLKEVRYKVWNSMSQISQQAHVNFEGSEEDRTGQEVNPSEWKVSERPFSIPLNSLLTPFFSLTIYVDSSSYSPRTQRECHFWYYFYLFCCQKWRLDWNSNFRNRNFSLAKITIEYTRVRWFIHSFLPR